MVVGSQLTKPSGGGFLQRVQLAVRESTYICFVLWAVLWVTLGKEGRKALGKARREAGRLEGQWYKAGSLLEGETLIPERDLGVSSGHKDNLKQHLREAVRQSKTGGTCHPCSCCWKGLFLSLLFTFSPSADLRLFYI